MFAWRVLRRQYCTLSVDAKPPLQRSRPQSKAHSLKTLQKEIERLKVLKRKAVEQERYTDADRAKKQLDNLESDLRRRVRHSEQRKHPVEQRVSAHRGTGASHSINRQPPSPAPQQSETRRDAVALRKPAANEHSHAFTNDSDDGWKDFEGQEAGEAALHDRPFPPAHAWRPMEQNSATPQGRQRANKATGAWTGRKEDEVRILSSWKGPGGAWTWRVVDSEIKLDNNGFDATRTIQTKPWCSMMAGALLTEGVHEWEVRLTGNTRACRVGVAAPDASLHENLAWGRESVRAWVATDLGTLWHNEAVVARGTPLRLSGDVVSLRCDMNAKTLHIAVNQDTARKAPCFFSHLPAGGVRPVVSLRELPATVEMRHIFSSVPPVDSGPFRNGTAVVRGQVLDVPKVPLPAHARGRDG